MAPVEPKHIAQPSRRMWSSTANRITQPATNSTSEFRSGSPIENGRGRCRVTLASSRRYAGGRCPVPTSSESTERRSGDLLETFHGASVCLVAKHACVARRHLLSDRGREVLDDLRPRDRCPSPRSPAWPSRARRTRARSRPASGSRRRTGGAPPRRRPRDRTARCPAAGACISEVSSTAACSLSQPGNSSPKSASIAVGESSANAASTTMMRASVGLARSWASQAAS